MQTDASCHIAHSGMTKTTTYTYVSRSAHHFQRHLNEVSLSSQSTNDGLHEENNSTSFMQRLQQQLSDIRQMLKPWYFRGATQFNGNLARNFALDFSNDHAMNQEVSYAVVYKRVQFEFNIVDDHHCLAKGAKPQKLLSDYDRCLLEQMHETLKSLSADVQVVDKIARQIVLSRMGNGQEGASRLTSQSLLDRVSSEVESDSVDADALAARFASCRRQHGEGNVT